MPAFRHSAIASGTPGRTGSERPRRPTSRNPKSCCPPGSSVPVPKLARATPRTLRPFAASAAMRRSSAAASSAERWQRSAIASGAPFAAMTCSLLSGERQTRDIARSSRESGYSRRSSQSRWRCSVPASVRSPSSRIAFSIGSKGSSGLARIANSTSSWKASGSRVPAGSTARVSSPTARSATVIRFIVSVPVLSTQSAVAEPSVSTAGHAAGQDVVLRDAPGPQREEDRQDDRELLGEHRHPEGQAREEPLQEVAPRDRVDGDDRQAEPEADEGEEPHEARRLALERGVLGLENGEGLADLPHLRRGADREHLGHALTLDDEGSREDEGRVVAPGPPHLHGAAERTISRPVPIRPSGATRRRRDSSRSSRPHPPARGLPRSGGGRRRAPPRGPRSSSSRPSAPREPAGSRGPGARPAPARSSAPGRT